MNFKWVLSLLIIFSAIVLIGCKVMAQQGVNEEKANMSDKKSLIVYYSYSGNTEALAKRIQLKTKGDIFKIETIEPYPTSYNEVVEQAKKEKASDFRPKLKSKVENINDYDVIYIGTPVWWYTMAPAVKSFITENDMKGKTIIPFCTHGGGGASSTFTDIAKLLPESTVKKGFVAYENTASDNDITEWLESVK